MEQVLHTKSLQYLSSNDIDQIIDMEMQCFKTVCMGEEDNYIKGELEKNPINVNRSTKQQISNRCQEEQGQKEQPQQKYKTIEQCKRSEACRRSRMNRKIKILKNKYRHDFMIAKLKLTMHYFEYIRGIITDMEMELMHQGLVTTNHVHDLRMTFKIYHQEHNDNVGNSSN